MKIHLRNILSGLGVVFLASLLINASNIPEDSKNNDPNKVF